MPSKLDSLEQMEVTTRAQWRAWLKMHHTRTTGVWLVYWKKEHAGRHVGYAALVEEALCFGWIDSTARALDADRSMLHLCPRKPKSVWSKVNKERVERLIRSRRMARAGLRAIETAKANGSWNALDAVEALHIPEDLERAFKRNRTARKHFDAFPPSARKFILHHITSAKTKSTRDARIAKVVAKAAKGERLNA
ncbi:MAG TPA: YdeI/OmpD-associated family protein [Flavobacteriales bacterium]|nr:YdeI/OmpD-associated family protein [Flavobacteriales bacterium]HNU58083.1 YdeI/OmpD-associated family protein [Flavobacteriales bacterium]